MITTSKSFWFCWRLALLAILITGFSSECYARQTDDALRIDVAPDARLKIENRLGGVAIEIWREKYVEVSAQFPEGKKTGQFPVIISNQPDGLSISVMRRPIDPPAVVDLTVKLPETNHLQATTFAGTIAMRGMPASAQLQSSAGDVRTTLFLPADLQIVASAAQGVLKSDLQSVSISEQHALQARLGTGSRILKINTITGNIEFSEEKSAEAIVPHPAPNDSNKPPQIVGTNQPKSAGSPANGADEEEVGEGDVIRVDSQLVSVNVNAIDRNTSRGLQGLTQSDFRMFEDGLEQRILEFEAASAPFDLFLLIDLSGSTKDVLKLIKAASLRFVDAARSSDRIGIVTFAGQPKIVSSLTLDRAILRQRVDTMDTAAGDTKLYDAIDFVINEISKERTKTRRTAIVLMSDGLDGSIPGVQGDGSKLSYPELQRRIQEFDGVLYTLWLNTEYEALNPLDTQPEAFDMGHDRMKELADNGGGLFYEVERLESLAGAYERVVADLGTVYSLAYRPAKKVRDGTWRSIRVDINRPNAVARGKRGYYAN